MHDLYSKQIGKRVREKPNDCGRNGENRNGLRLQGREGDGVGEIGSGTATISGNNYKREHSPKCHKLLARKGIKERETKNCNGKCAGRSGGVAWRQARIGKRAKLHNLCKRKRNKNRKRKNETMQCHEKQEK